MPDSEQANVQPDITHFVEKENHPEQKQQMIVTGHHVLRAKVDKRDDVHPGDFLDVPFVAFRHAVHTRPGCRKAVTTGKTDKPNAPELKAGERSTGPVYQGWYT